MNKCLGPLSGGYCWFALRRKFRGNDDGAHEVHFGCYCCFGDVLAIQTPAQAADYSSPFALTIGSDTWDYTYRETDDTGNNTCNTYSGGVRGGFFNEVGHQYSTYTMTIPFSGNYAYTDASLGLDMVAAVYSLNGFDPTSPSTNCLAGADSVSGPDWNLTAGSYTIVVGNYDSGEIGGVVFTITGPGAVAISDSPPVVTEPSKWTLVRQSLPLPKSGTCSDLVDKDYAWGTGQTGGWLKAWEPWAGPRNGAGGWACLRTLVNKGGNGWSVGNSGS